MQRKHIIITGASSGIGHLAAKELSRRGHAVWATMRDVAGRNREAARELTRIGLSVMEMDVTADDSVATAVAAVAAEAGRIDVLVNNAGRGYMGLAEAFSVDSLRAQLEINLLGSFRVARAVLPHMRRQRSGLLVQISTIIGRTVMPFMGPYAASKFGVEALTEAFRYELSGHGVDVTIVEPGPFDTRFAGSLVGPDDAEVAAAYGESAQTAFAGLVTGLTDMFADDAAPTDPSLVAGAIADLVDREPGTRPLRLTVGADFGVAELNAAMEPFRLGVLDAVGLGHLDHAPPSVPAT